MPTFLFKADDRDGNPVTKGVEAADLKAARELLETRGYVGIEFLNGELAGEMLDSYDPKVRQKIARNPGLYVAAMEETRLGPQLFVFLKSIWFIYPAIAVVMLAGGPKVALIVALLFSIAVLYLFTPGIIHYRLSAAKRWERSRALRFWTTVAKLFNPFLKYKFEKLQIDFDLARADALDGDAARGLARLEPYSQDPKVVPAWLRFMRSSVLYAARDYRGVRDVCEAAFGELTVLESVDFARLLALRFGETDRAREILDGIMDHDVSAWERGWVSYSRGMVETVAENFERAEFFLDNAYAQFDAYRNNQDLDPTRFCIAYFQGVVYAGTGRATVAREKLSYARPYLVATRDTQLLARCDELLAD